MKTRNSIRLIHPRSGAVTRPLQRYEHRKQSGRAGNGLRSTFGADAWKPVRGNAAFSIETDRSLPAPVRFVWETDHGTTGEIAYDLLISQKSDFRDPIAVKGIHGGYCDVLHLHIDTCYFWKLIARDSHGPVAESPVRSFVTHAAAPRWISVPEITNARDMGGWPLPGNRTVKQGLIYRSSEMNSHVNITEDGKHLLIHQLKIRTDLDLRHSNEEIRPVLDEALVEWINIPVGPYGTIIDDCWREGYRRIFRVLAQRDRYPILFHCWGGADRAGTLAFLIHALLGMRLTNLIRDYELTSLSIWGPRSHESAEFRTLREVLHPFGRHKNDMTGQVEGYLRFIGVTRDEIASIRRLLIERNKRT